jgi:hypothetical protein
MLGIERRAVLTDRVARVIGVVEAIVAGLAEVAERAESERGEVTPMRHDVISDRRRHDMTALARCASTLVCCT